jgi:hypothetical protein
MSKASSLRGKEQLQLQVEGKGGRWNNTEDTDSGGRGEYKTRLIPVNATAKPSATVTPAGSIEAGAANNINETGDDAISGTVGGREGDNGNNTTSAGSVPNPADDVTATAADAAAADLLAKKEKKKKKKADTAAAAAASLTGDSVAVVRPSSSGNTNDHWLTKLAAGATKALKVRGILSRANLLCLLAFITC